MGGVLNPFSADCTSLDSLFLQSSCSIHPNKYVISLVASNGRTTLPISPIAANHSTISDFCSWVNDQPLISFKTHQICGKWKIYSLIQLKSWVVNTQLETCWQPTHLPTPMFILQSVWDAGLRQVLHENRHYVLWTSSRAIMCCLLHWYTKVFKVVLYVI